MKKITLEFKTYFSDFFEIDSKLIEDYVAFNISLINDLPLFIDPFLLFNSKKQEYQKLHQDIIDYLLFLKSISNEQLTYGDINNYFKFHEIKQNWFGYSKIGNGGHGLDEEFANGLIEGFRKYLINFGKETGISTHLEKVCLFETGIGKDNISDFTTNLIVGYLAEYTEKFANQNIDNKFLEDFRIRKYEFNYQTKSWISKIFKLPFIINSKSHKEYVLLTPKDILTKDNPWINNKDKLNQFYTILETVPNEQLRSQINRYFDSILKKDESEKVSKKDEDSAKLQTYQQYPELIDIFIKIKEENGDRAVAVSNELVSQTKSIFIDFAKEIIKLLSQTDFYKQKVDSFEDMYKRLLYFKNWVENKGGWKLFYNKHREITNEPELQLLFKLTHFESTFDINAEVNNGSGPVDFKSSMGSKDKTIVEFKLARNSKFKQNVHPQGQVRVYEKSNNTKKSIKVFFCFNKSELKKVEKTIKDYQLNEKQVVIINCSKQASASDVNPSEFDDWDIEKMNEPSFGETDLNFEEIDLEIEEINF
jgi:hypothetical protein